jgi:mono/diheme cytochrome c family protein
MESSLTSSLAALALGLPLFAATAAQEPGDRPQSAATRELFLANCATCHGEEGDGEGVTDLDRKARSFRAGGFSFGNTPETVTRTITTGIPGTPMPAFGEALEAQQLEDLALYVIELGPGEAPPPKNTELVVKERPLIVRGMLPPIAEDASTHPRGLLIGLPDGFTFEYRTDDVRLLGVRQGLFVNRTDWIGRGGTGLDPLGVVVALFDRGEPQATFSRVEGALLSPLTARFRGSRVLQGGGELRYDLMDGTGERRARVKESVKTIALSFGVGYRRDFLLTGGERDLPLAVNDFRPREPEPVRFFSAGYELRSRLLPGDEVEFRAWIRQVLVPKRIPHIQSQEEGEFLLEAGHQSLLCTLKFRLPREVAEELEISELHGALTKGLDFWRL